MRGWGSSAMTTRRAKRVGPAWREPGVRGGRSGHRGNTDRPDAYAPSDATAAPPGKITRPPPMAFPPGMDGSRRPRALVLPKRRVLELYLNTGEWGPDGQVGGEAGSRYAFNKSVRSLTRREGGLLAAVRPSPRRRSAKQPGPAVRRLAAIYEARG